MELGPHGFVGLLVFSNILFTTYFWKSLDCLCILLDPLVCSSVLLIFTDRSIPIYGVVMQ